MSRIDVATYARLRAWMLANDPDASGMIQWAQRETGRPATPEDLAAEVIWIILCAGRSAQAARTISRKVWAKINAGAPVVEAFGYRAKAAAIERAWRERQRDFEQLQQIPADDVERLVEWCGALPFVGDDTKFQLAKNFGADLCKPDIWVSRIAGFPDRPRRNVKVRFPACMALCRHLGEGVGDSIAVVDSVLWLACNKGVLRVGADAGPVVFDPATTITARSIYTAGAA